LRERFREETRRAILGAAEIELAEKGVAGARMEDIAKAAGVAVGTVYNYFSDREQLVAALLDLRRAELLERLDAVLARAGKLGYEKLLEAYLLAAFTHVEEHIPFFRLLLEEELKHGSGSRKRTIMREILTRAEKLVEIGVKARKLRPSHQNLYPAMLIGIMRGLWVRHVLEPTGEPLVASVGAALEFFLKGAGQGA
jgi:AcrR family transcriptional regulator